MQYGPYAVDYEYRPYNPERMRNERVARAQASLKKYGLGAMIVYDYDYHRYLGYYSFHQYARRRLGTFVLLIQGQGLPYVPYRSFEWPMGAAPNALVRRQNGAEDIQSLPTLPGSTGYP